MSALRDLLGFLGKPYVWFTLVVFAVIGIGWVSPADAKDLVSQVIGAVKDWNPLGGGP